jgi:threonine dehydrogenase-like Zn-dependent dehydrogenase
VLLADAWVTGWHATELAGVYPTVTVAIFGAGAVGLLTAYSALLRGAAEVYVVDMIAERLEKAGQIGAVPINFLEGDPVEQIVEVRRRNQRLMGSLAPGDEQMMGVMCGIDCVGFQARDREDPSRELAALASNVGTWMQNVAAAWLMTSLTSSATLVALVQTATSLPIVLAGLPSGAIGDVVDRRKLLPLRRRVILDVRLPRVGSGA